MRAFVHVSDGWRVMNNAMRSGGSGMHETYSFNVRIRNQTVIICYVPGEMCVVFGVKRADFRMILQSFTFGFSPVCSGLSSCTIGGARYVGW